MTNTKKTRSAGISFSKFTLILVLTVVVALPLLRMMATLRPSDFADVFSGHHFGTALKNSLVYTSIATAISVGIAYILAICTVRVDIKFKRILSIILTLPMLIPSISHGTGLIILFGSSGIIKNLLGIEGASPIYGAPGIIIGSVMYAFPVAYIMLSDVLRYEDMSIYEASEILGISPARTFFKISLPYMRKPLITAAFSIFAMIVTDYGVPLVIGGKEKTLSSLMYETAIGASNLDSGAVYGLVLLVPAIVAFVVDLFSREKASSAFVRYDSAGKTGALRRIAAYLVCAVMTVFSLLPILTFVLLSFIEKYPQKMNFTLEHYEFILKVDWQHLLNSVLIAFITSIVGTAIGFFASYLTSRMKSPLSRVLHLLSICSMAIPGMVLGISYLMTFAGSPLYGTFAILIMVNTAHFMSSPYLMMYNSFGKMNENLEAVGSTLGIGRVRMLFRIFLPECFGTLAEMFSYLFVNSMMTISAVAFLANSSTRPISLMISVFERSQQLGRIAVVSLFILLANIIVKIAVDRIKALAARRQTEK